MHGLVINIAPTDVTCWEKLNDLLYLVAKKCGWLDIIQGKLVGPHKSVILYSNNFMQNLQYNLLLYIW